MTTSEPQKYLMFQNDLNLQTEALTCLLDQALKAWFTSTRSVYHASGPLAFFRICVIQLLNMEDLIIIAPLILQIWNKKTV